jgi:hypothetical protein
MTTETWLPPHLEAKRQELAANKARRASAPLSPEQQQLAQGPAKLRRWAWAARLIAVGGVLGLYALQKAGLIEVPLAVAAVAGLGGFVLGCIGFAPKAFAFARAEKASAGQVQKAHAKGLVTGVKRVRAGAVSDGAGFTYANVYSVEFDVSGESHTLPWESAVATNIETLLDREAEERLGSVVDVHYEPGNPHHASVGPIPSVIGIAAIAYLIGVLGWYTFLTLMLIGFIDPPPRTTRF